MLWRHFRREVTHCELFTSVHALLEATREFFDRPQPHARQGALNHRGADPTGLVTLYLGRV